MRAEEGGLMCKKARQDEQVPMPTALDSVGRQALVCAAHRPPEADQLWKPVACVDCSRCANCSATRNAQA